MAELTVTDDHHPSQLMEGLTAMRKAGEHFDFVIKGSAESFPIHSVVLAAMSPVFNAMLKPEYKESRRREASFPEIPDDTMRHVIDFAYTGRCTFTEDDLCDLLAAADFLAMSKLVQLCASQIYKVVEPSNCFSWLAIAQLFQLGTPVIAMIQKTMVTAHTEVMLSTEFVEAESTELADYIRNLSRMGIQSDRLLQAVVAWIEHDIPQRSVHMSKLFSCLSLDKCTKPCLEKIVKDKFGLLESEQQVERFLENMNRDNTTKNADQLLILGGESDGVSLGRGNGRNKGCYILRDDIDALVEFTEVTVSGVKLFDGCSVSKVPQGVVVTGGGRSDTCQILDLKTRRWVDKANLPSKRAYHGSGFIQGKLFVIGGISASDLTKTVDYMDIEKNTWHNGPDMPQIELSPQVVVFHDKLFVLLTKSGRLYSLDPIEMVWTLKSTLPTTSGRNFSMAVFNDWLYVTDDVSRIHYMYVPSVDTWHALTGPNMPQAGNSLVNSSLVCVNNKLFLIPAYNKDSEVTETEIQVYDIFSDKWSLAKWKKSKPLRRFYGVSVVNVSM